MEKGTVGQMRAQSPYKDHTARVIIKVVDDAGMARYYKAETCWPDTSQSPAGEGFYFETSEASFLFAKPK